MYLPFNYVPWLIVPFLPALLMTEMLSLARNYSEEIFLWAFKGQPKLGQNTEGGTVRRQGSVSALPWWDGLQGSSPTWGPLSKIYHQHLVHLLLFQLRFRDIFHGGLYSLQSALYMKHLTYLQKCWKQLGDWVYTLSRWNVSPCLCGRARGQAGFSPIDASLWVRLEKEMATHSSILAWKIPWTEEPGLLQSMGLQRVRCDWVTERTHYGWGGSPQHQSLCICLLFTTGPQHLAQHPTHCSVPFSSVAQSCPTLCDPMNRSTPGLPVHHQLLEFTQTQVHQVGDAIQPSHPLSSPSPPAPNPSQHQGLFQWVSSSHEVAKVLESQLQHQSFQWTPRTDLL